jgi:uncharacterized protein involved in exopolysaccharide biosynthesis
MNADVIQSSPGFFGRLWARKWLILATATLSVAVTVVVTSWLPARYRSEAVILLVPQQVPATYVGSVVSRGLEERLLRLERQILSRTHLEKTIQKFDLYQEDRQRDIMEEVVKRMRHDINVRARGVSRHR